MHEDFSRLVQVMNELREKCPWDKEQTHQSLTKYLVEETYELLEAIESGDLDSMREELGDLLLQIVFHARIASEGKEGSAFTIDDVANGISEKLIARHPHVFGNVEAASAEEVERNWEALKSAEKKRESVVDGIPLSQPALSWTSAVIERARKKGIGLALGEMPLPQGVTTEAVGNLLLSVVALAQQHGIDPEQALREAGRGLISQVKAQESAG